MQEGEGIRKSPYEEGLYFVQPERGTTLQDHSTQWQVGWSGGLGVPQWYPAPGVGFDVRQACQVRCALLERRGILLARLCRRAGLLVG